jgi:hypothetical protein
MEQLPMFPPSESPTLELSDHFNRTPWLVERGDKIKYVDYRRKGSYPCQECQQRQYELKGHAQSKRETRKQRVLMKRGSTKKDDRYTLDLCNAHAVLWQSRDGV